jgi:oligopeptide transport system ATP-binding protein
MSTILDVNGLKKHFPLRRGIWQRTVGTLRAVDDVSFQVARGETMGLVGESGCGKTTIARTIVRLSKPTAGQVIFEGRNLDGLSARELRKIRPEMQMIFQDPYASLNPRMNVGGLVGEPLLEHSRSTKAERRERVAELLNIVGLDSKFVGRYPHEFSGGQQQRIGIARALVLNPDLIICDQPTSALDVSIQAQIVNLLEDIQHGSDSPIYLSPTTLA